MNTYHFGSPERPVPTVAAYLAGLNRINVTQTRTKMFLANLSAPNATITATEMTQRVFGKNGHSTANLQYGKLAKALAEAMSISLTGEKDAVTFLVTFEHKNGECNWTLHNNLASALREYSI